MTSQEQKFSQIDEVSSCFCIAKWLQVTIDLVHGTNHSCHHPKRHKIPLDQLAKDPSALHNTLFKKQQRKIMLEGTRPPECSYCWTVEDTEGRGISDRYIKSTDPWAYPHLEKVKQLAWKENINPTYVEVMFDKVCNLACSYCLADISSSIANEMRKFGPYPVHNKSHRDFQETAAELVGEVNPYVEAFWKWFPEILEDLEVFRITGGEPLLNSNTFKVIDYLGSSVSKKLTLAVNSNLCLEDHLIKKFTKGVNQLLVEGRIKDFELYASVDTYGQQAEYIRNGLDYSQFIKNVEYFCSEAPSSRVVMMCTYSVLSIPGFDKLLKELSELKKKYSNLILDISFLRHPEYLRANMVTPDLVTKIAGDIELMKELATFSEYEIGKLTRIYDWVSAGATKDQNNLYRMDFYSFVNEYDRRKGTNFLESFPELGEFYTVCRKTKMLLG
ncbi:MAG: radical SAM protein [Halobacteriovoraceae bacterium]|jgi:MoaA/NifB/PqqE/SkfB family radical SAM enzyme|nr:radical SAM protein [Halobacteriovoraceae bacterium]